MGEPPSSLLQGVVDDAATGAGTNGQAGGTT